MSASPQAKPAPAQQRAEVADAVLASVGSQSVFRALNEEIRRIGERLGVDDLELVCECERADCFARLSVPTDSYQAVRRFPMRFLTKIDHVGADEHIVEEAASYAVVEKVGASADRLAAHSADG